MIETITRSASSPSNLVSSSSPSAGSSSNLTTAMAASALASTASSSSSASIMEATAVDQKALPPSLAKQIIGTIQAANILKATQKQDAWLTEKLSELEAKMREHFQKALDQIEQQCVLSLELNQRREAFKATLTEHAHQLRTKIETFKKNLTVSTDQNQRDILAEELMRELTTAQNLFAELCKEALILTQLYLDQWKQVTASKGKATLPITEHEVGEIKATDAQIAAKVKTEIIDAHHANKLHNDRLAEHLKKGQAIASDLEIVGIVISEMAAALPLAADHAKKTASPGWWGWGWSWLTGKQKTETPTGFNRYAPDPRKNPVWPKFQ